MHIYCTYTCSVQWWIWIEQTTKKCLDRLQIAAHFLERRRRRSLNYILFVRGCCVVARRTFAEHCWALFADSKLINVLLTQDAHTTYILYISSHAIRSPQHTNRTPPLHHKCSFGFRYFCASSFRTNQSSATLAVINCLHSQQADPTHAHTHTWWCLAAWMCIEITKSTSMHRAQTMGALHNSSNLGGTSPCHRCRHTIASHPHTHSRSASASESIIAPKKWLHERREKDDLIAPWTQYVFVFVSACVMRCWSASAIPTFLVKIHWHQSHGPTDDYIMPYQGESKSILCVAQVHHFC